MKVIDSVGAREKKVWGRGRGQGKKSDILGVDQGIRAEHFDRRITLNTHYVNKELNVSKCQMILAGIPYNISN